MWLKKKLGFRMPSNQTEAGSANRKADRIKRGVEAYQTSMKSFFKAHTILDPETLNEEHNRIVDIVSDGFAENKKRDLNVFLYEQLLNMLVLEEERLWQNSEENTNENSLCIYFTWDWVYVIGYTRKLGAININFGNANHKPGFTAEIKHRNGKLAWNETTSNLANDKHGNTLKADTMWGIIYSAYSGNETNRNLLVELFERVKEYAEGRMGETVSQMMLVKSHSFRNVCYREILRECCMKAGFQRIVIASDKSLSAFRIFFNLQLDNLNPQPVYILVAVIHYQHISMYVYGDLMSGDETGRVQHLAAANCDLVSKENVKSGYKRALAQLPTKRRDSTRYYVILNEWKDSDREKIIDEVFREGEKLTKLENKLGDKLKDIFSYFCSDSTKPRESLYVLTSIPTDNPTVETNSKPCPVEDRINASQAFVANSSANPSSLRPQVEHATPQVVSVSNGFASGVRNQQVTPGSSTLPLWIHTVHGKTFKINALTNWTVKRLKQAFLESYPEQQELGQLVIKYGAEVLKDRDQLISYMLDSDSVIQANFGNSNGEGAEEVHNLDGQYISESQTRGNEVMGKCIAHESKLASKCNHCTSRQFILNYYKIDLNASSKSNKDWKLGGLSTRL